MKKLILVILIPVFFTQISSASTKVVLVSDLNGSYGSKDYHPAVYKSIEQIARLTPDLVISTGDMVAGQKAGLDYKGMWESFHNAITLPLKKLGIPFAVTPGNHDGSGELAFKKEREEFKLQWKNHSPNLNFIDQSNYPSFYAFSLNEILFISLDATLIGKLPENQRTWLKTLLEKNISFKKKVLFGHLPIFPVSKTKESEYIKDPELIKIMKDSKVDLFLSGHHHAYYPGIYEGIHQISQGCLGAGPRTIIGENLVTTRSITVIDFNDNNSISVDAYTGPELDQLIERKTLPEKIQQHDQFMWRDDLVLF